MCIFLYTKIRIILFYTVTIRIPSHQSNQQQPQQPHQQQLYQQQSHQQLPHQQPILSIPASLPNLPMNPMTEFSFEEGVS